MGSPISGIYTYDLSSLTNSFRLAIGTLRFILSNRIGIRRTILAESVDI